MGGLKIEWPQVAGMHWVILLAQWHLSNVDRIIWPESVPIKGGGGLLCRVYSSTREELLVLSLS